MTVTIAPACDHDRGNTCDCANLLLQFLCGTDEPSWTKSALCSQTDPELFFPEKGGSSQAAKSICADCPVQEECLQDALDHNEQFGIWGGLSARERRKLRPQAHASVDVDRPCESCGEVLAGEPVEDLCSACADVDAMAA